MRQSLHELVVATRGQGLIDVTKPVTAWLAGAGIATGLLTVWCRHTSASLLVQENASPAVRADIEAFLSRLAPEGTALYQHDEEGPDDMPAHLRALLTQTQVGVPVSDGRLCLGTWQAIYLFEHRHAPHRRSLVLHVIGE